MYIALPTRNLCVIMFVMRVLVMQVCTAVVVLGKHDIDEGKEVPRQAASRSKSIFKKKKKKNTGALCFIMYTARRVIFVIFAIHHSARVCFVRGV